jgi:hypothetical protein
MPGGRSRAFRFGDRAELLVQQLLTSLAFTSPVPRQEDIGVDFLCSLITGYGDPHLLKAGPFFSVQAKSSTEPIEYKKPHEIQWITHQENPLLICVADRDHGAMDVYSTWNLLCGVAAGWKGKREPNCVRLCPGESYESHYPGVVDQADESQNILLGKPIVRITHQQAFDERSTREIAEVIEAWIALDRENIVNVSAGLNWIAGPFNYETGKPLREQLGVTFYWNPKNLPKCARNLNRSAVALWRLLHEPGSAATLALPIWDEFPSATLGELLLWSVKADPELKPFLKDLDAT